MLTTSYKIRSINNLERIEVGMHVPRSVAMTVACVPV